MPLHILPTDMEQQLITLVNQLSQKQGVTPAELLWDVVSIVGAIKCMTLAYMKTKQTSGNRRSKDRVVKSLSLPASLVERVQAEADKHYGGDFTRATLEILATRYVEAKKFLRENETFKFSRKKV
jgi:hypothetical protein